MDTNRHEGLRGEAALECGGLKPLSRARLTNGGRFGVVWRVWRTIFIMQEAKRVNVSRVCRKCGAALRLVTNLEFWCSI